MWQQHVVKAINSYLKIDGDYFYINIIIVIAFAFA